MPSYVLKLGGSLIETSRDLMQVLISLADEEDCSFLVVPGGGPFADLIRGINVKRGLGDEAAHWMAVLAMEQYAFFLADGNGARLSSEVRIPEKGRVNVLLPYRALTEGDFCPEHSWDYTSDSIALLVAARLGLPLIKA
ncbi:MAG: uridylate kinase, partial [Methanothrix sp.]